MNKQMLRELAEKYVNGELLIDCLVDINDGNLRIVAIRILGVIDGLWQRGQITAEEARQVYPRLGLDPNEITKIRNSSKKASDFSRN